MTIRMIDTAVLCGSNFGFQASPISDERMVWFRVERGGRDGREGEMKWGTSQIVMNEKMK